MKTRLFFGEFFLSFSRFRARSVRAGRARLRCHGPSEIMRLTLRLYRRRSSPQPMRRTAARVFRTPAGRVPRNAPALSTEHEVEIRFFPRGPAEFA